MADFAQGAYMKALWKILSQERLQGGYGGPAMPRPDVLARYLWNAALCEALYPSLQALEVALRNTLFSAGSVVYPFSGPAQAGQVPCWLDVPGMLHTGDTGMIEGAKARLLAANKPLEPGRLVAELTFGFWTALFDVRYENTRILWPRFFSQKIFAHAPNNKRNRKSLSPLLNRIRHLRNRVFHHEPIWHWRDLPDQHALALDLIGWMSPELRRTMVVLDRFAAVYAAGPEPFREVVSRLSETSPAARPEE